MAEGFKAAIRRVREIFHGPPLNIVGMDSMYHICIYLMARCMTSGRCPLFGIPLEFAWDTLLQDAQSEEGGMQHALDKFWDVAGGDCLLRHFDHLFATQQIQFLVKDIHKHYELMVVFNEVNIEAISSVMETDVLGWIYEEHLNTGSAAARELGQFFTDRFVCRYNINLCRPKIVSGVPESVCDPTMGTGGFLTSTVQYFKTFHPSEIVDWAQQASRMCGCDTDPRLAMIAKLNLFLELGACIHPGNISGVLQRDSLAEGLLQAKYDVIVANVPFGIQGLSAEGCCATVKELNIPGIQPEPLFLQLIMASLNVGGRSAVVVPEGMLFKKSKQHVKTRLYLLDHFELHRVVKFEEKGKPPVLFFENTGQATQSIQFWSVHKTSDGEVSEKLVCTVARSKLDAAFSLDVRHYAESALPTSAAFPVVRLEDIAVHKNGKTLKGSEKDESAAFDVMGGGMDYNGLYADFNREGTTISVSKSGASAGYVKLHTRKFWAGDCLTVAPKDVQTCDVRYLYYFLKLETNFKEKSHGTTIPHCDWGSIKDTFVPLPPLTVQKEVAYALDRVYTPGTVELAETLMGVSDGPLAEVLLRKALRSVSEIHARTIGDLQFQMTALMNAMRAELRPLSETCSVSFGERITEKKDAGTMFPVYGSGGESFKTDRFNRTGRTCKLGRFAVSEANMVMMVNGPYWLMDSGFTVQSKDETTLLTAFLHYYFATHKKELAGLSAGSWQKNIDMDAFYAMAIPVPPPCVQHDMVARLDVLQAHLESIKAMESNSDSNARIILASYLGAESPKMEQTQDEISL